MTVVQAFRLANWDTPLWVSPNRRESRFARVSDSIVQYWCLHPLTCWAEHLRYHGIRDPSEAVELRTRPWVASLELPDNTDLSFDNAADMGLDPDALVDDDWTRCQQWAEAVRPSPAITVPSAALPGTRNVVLFGPRVRTRFGSVPFDPDVDVPTDPVADIATVITSLLPHVRWRGEPHGGFEAWRSGAPQPDPPMIEVDRSP